MRSGAIDVATAKLVGSAFAVHAHALDAANADQLNADVIAAVALIGKRHELLRRGVQVGFMADDAARCPLPPPRRAARRSTAAANRPACTW